MARVPGWDGRPDRPARGGRRGRGCRRAATGCRPRRSRLGGPHRLRHSSRRGHRGRRGPRRCADRGRRPGAGPAGGRRGPVAVPRRPDRHAWTEVPGPDAAPSLEFAMVAGSAPAASRSVLEGRCAAGPRANAVGDECARLVRAHGEVSVERGAAVWGRLLRDGTDVAGFSDAAVAPAAVSLHAGGTPALRDALAGWLTPGLLTTQEMHPGRAGRSARAPPAAVVGQPARAVRCRHVSAAAGPAHPGSRVPTGPVRRPRPDGPGARCLEPGQRCRRSRRPRPSPRSRPGLLPRRAAGTDGHRRDAPPGDVSPSGGSAISATVRRYRRDIEEGQLQAQP